jgi:hypothetical protein
MSKSSSARLLIGALLVAALALVSSSCLEDPSARRVFSCPDRQVFALYVSPMMERRCGTLDCHGSDFRPMRLYGEIGLRHPAELNYAGGDATTPLELGQNYRAICSLEPEAVDEVAKDPGGQSVNRLLLVRKARGQEAHKGGKVFNPFDNSDLCVVGWLRGDNPKSVREACQNALDQLPDSVTLPPVEP